MKHLLFAILILLLTPLSGQAKTEIKWGDVLPPGSPSILAMKQVSKEVSSKTNGRIKIKVFSSGQLGSSREMIESVTLGFQEMVTEGAANLGQWVPSISILEAPYIWRDLDHLYNVMNGPIGKKLKDELRNKKGLRVLGIFYNGVRHVTTSNIAINSVKDMEGIKLRVPENEVFLAMAKSWGAKPTPMNFSELYLALRQNVVDGQENPLPTIDSAKLYEVQKYLILTGHIITPRLIVVSESFWQSLSKEDREIISKAIERGVAYNNREIINGERSLIEKFKKGGVTIISPDKKSFRDAVLKTVPLAFEKKWGEGLYDKIGKSK